MERVVIVNGVPRSRSSRLMHDLVMSLLLLRFEVGRLVDTPVVVSFELLKMLWEVPCRQPNPSFGLRASSPCRLLLSSTILASQLL
jgi:hypothetical protein